VETPTRVSCGGGCLLPSRAINECLLFKGFILR
jgi:hypothetical protein